MGNRTAKFISALIGGVIAGAPLAAVSQNAPATATTTNAAADCLASPKGVAPQGQHWHYRLERSTKRQCWYLRAEGAKDSAKPSQTAQAATDTSNADSAAPQSVQNARAEYMAPQNVGGSNVTTPAPAAAPAAQPQSGGATDNAQQPAVAPPWPDASPASAAPAPQPSPAPVAAQPNAKPAKPSAAVALATAEIPADKATGSLQMLLLVVGGALALAGILASIVYRFAGGRRVHVQATDHRRVNWDNWEPHEHDDSRAPWLNATPAGAPRAQQPRPVDFDEVRPQSTQLAAFTKAISRIAAQSASTHVEAAEPHEAELEEAEIAIFNGQFEIEPAAPKLAANEVHDEDEAHDEEPAGHDENAQVEDAVDVDVITAMLERLAKDGPRLTQPSLEAGLADLARSQRGQSAARA